MTDVPQTEKPARAATRGPGFQDIADTLAEIRAENAALRLDVATLSALVQAALPAALVRLPWESIQELIRDAPQTRLRLLAPFSSPMMNLAAGVEMDACDQRIRVHGKGMSIGLATLKSEAPAMLVKRMLADLASAKAAAGRELTRAGREAEAEQARSIADKLTARAATGT